ncbi:tape measure protein [uncultured Bacteroides sp.]|uniref:tape measure protein n=1 Tax=uncultured Bacteroides sp. TaxID=162156 RepID=UPI002638719E|nr:tape measure protein [uncultured Bacteroides sp.]
MAGLHFDITGDNTNLLRKLQETENGVKSVSKTVEQEGGNIENLFNRLTKSAAAIGVGFSAKEFVSKVAQIRGEFQKLEVAFTTMLGSKEQAENLMEQMVRTAATTPFSLQDVAGGAKQLLAYGIEAENVNETLIRLGDIAAGLSIPLGDLVYLYGTTRAQGRLYTEDFNQFTTRGIPMIEMLAEKFGVAESEVKGLVEAGKVGFPEVQEVIEKLTNEGGKFGGLMEAQSKTIAGQISNIEDAIETMFNDIGKANEGVINEALSGVSYLVENYEKVGREVLAVAAAYGTYKAVLMSVAAYQSVMVGVTYSTEIAELSKLIPLKQQSANEDIIAAVAAGRLTTAKAEQVIAIRTEIEAKRSSMQATLAAAQADTAAAQAAYKSALQRSVASKQAYAAKLKELEASKAYYANEALYNAAKTQQLSALADERSAAAKAKKVAAQNLEIARSKQNVAATALETFNTQANTAAQTANARSTNLLTVAKTKLAAASKALGLSMLANPYVVAAAAVATLTYGIYKLTTYQSDAEKAQSKLNDAIKESEKASLSEQRELAQLKGELSALTKGTDEYNTVKDKIVKGFSKYYDGLDEEIEKVGLTEQAYLKLADAITKSFGARQYEKFKSAQQEELDNMMSDNLSKIQERLIEKLGEEAGTKYYTKIRNAILKGNVSVGKGYLQISGIDNETKAALDKVAGKKEGKFYIANRDVEKYILNIVNAINATEKLDKLAKERFGISDTHSQATNQNKQVGDEETNYQEDYDAAKKAWEEAKKKLEEIENDKKAFTSKQYEDAKTDYDDKKKKYESLGGITSDKAVNDAKKQAEEQKKLQQELYETLIQLRFQNQQDEINLMEEGSEKKRKQIELDYQKELAEIKKLEKELSDKSGGKLTQEQSIEISRRYTNADARYTNGISEIEGGFTAEELKKSMNEYLASYGEYVDKRNAIIALGEEKKKGKNEWEQKIIDEETYKVLSDLDIEAAKTTSAISGLFGDMKDKTLKDLQEINKRGQEALEFLKSGEWDKEKGVSLGITKEQFDTLSQSPEKLKDISDALINNKRAAEELKPSYDKIIDGIKDFFNAGNDSKKLKQALSDIQSGMNDILQVCSFLENTFSSLGDAFGSETFTGISEGIGVAMDAMNSTLQGAQAGSMFGPIGASAGAAIGLVSSLASSITQIHDKKNEKRIQELQDQIDLLTSSYEKLGREIDKAYSKDASELIEQQNKLLEQQKVLIQNQIKEEQDKKKTDNERIKEWQQQIEDINEQLEDNKEAAIDAIFGEDLQSAIEEFSSAYIDAWSQGEDKATSARDTVKKMMQQMVTESIKAAIQGSKSMEEIRRKLQEFYTDNVLSGWEQDYIYNMAEELQKELDKQFGWADDLFKESSSEQQSASSRGFETMSQGTADELNGRFTAMYEVGLQILQNISSIQSISVSAQSSDATLLEIKNLMILSNGYLEDISTFAKKILEGFGKKLDDINTNLKNAL